jgi:pimeloyl-ACP methyl ester carboxylesterase
MRTIVLIPGLMNDGAVWVRQIPFLSREGPVFVANNDGLSDLAAMADRILAATAGPLVVVGHSMGGRVAIELAVKAPERVELLVLLDTGAHPAAPAEAETRLKLVDLGHREGMAAVVEAWLPEMVAPDTPMALRDEIGRMLQRCTPADFDRQQRALLSRPDRRDALAAISCPTLVVTGELDGFSPPAQHEAMAAALPRARLHIVPRAGHMLPLEAPELVTNLLLGFLPEG